MDVKKTVLEIMGRRFKLGGVVDAFGLVNFIKAQEEVASEVAALFALPADLKGLVERLATWADLAEGAVNSTTTYASVMQQASTALTALSARVADLIAMMERLGLCEEIVGYTEDDYSITAWRNTRAEQAERDLAAAREVAAKFVVFGFEDSDALALLLDGATVLETEDEIVKSALLKYYVQCKALAQKDGGNG